LAEVIGVKVRCPVCGEELDEREMEQHDHEIPDVIRNAGAGFPCPRCGREFDSEEHLVEHQALEHGSEDGPSAGSASARMRFGLDVSQHQLTWSELVERVRFAEAAGFDGAWVFDHFSALYGDPGGPCLEGWTLLAGLARETSSIRLGTLVSGMTHRNPSVLAAQAITVDHLSGGRLELGVGAAWNEGEHRALGIDFPSAGARMDLLEEGVQILKLLMTTDAASFDGRHARLERATLHPRPIQQPHPPLWIGGTGRRRLLPLAGRFADVWHGWADSAAELAEMNAIIDAAAERAGRDPRQVLRASALDLSQPADDIRRDLDMFAEGGVRYLTVGWPTEGKPRLDEFVERHLRD
jgi:F420-dependent oxidoreductase-like protein